MHQSLIEAHPGTELIGHISRDGTAIDARERPVAERMPPGIPLRINARLKDEFGGNPIWVKGNTRVMSHLMFGLLVLTVDQLMRLLQ